MFSKVLKRSYHSLIDIAKPVATALAENKPVVALETTILTHGMPYPSNLKTALAVEQIIYEQGAVPATIGVVNGRIKVGLDGKLLEVLASPETEKIKISRRDFPVALSRHLNGGTTVSGTLLVSKRVGIEVFITGGMGGVHRDVSDSMDVSADLVELSRSPVMVVSSGIKSILDIARTLEYLETFGVCVVTYAHSKDFPAFYTQKSGYQTEYNVTNPEDAADLLINIKKLGLHSGVLLGVPIPKEYSLSEQDMQNAIEKALKHCKETGISGKSITPFLLDQVSKITEGRSLDSNIALIKNNAMIGSRIAVALKKKEFLASSLNSSNSSRKYSTFADYNSSKISSKKVVVVGLSMMDIVVRPDKPIQIDGGTQCGVVKPTAGGVARNIADAVGKLLPNNSPIFITAIGNDSIGQSLWKSIEHVNCQHVIKSTTENSACCIVLLDQQGDSLGIIADMNIHRSITPEQIMKREEIFDHCALIVIDGNLSIDAIDCVLTLGEKKHIPVWFEPTDHTLVSKPFEIKGSSHRIHYCSPNFKELQKLASYLTRTPSDITLDGNINDVITEARDLAVRVLSNIPNIMVTLGKYGLLMVTLKQDKPKATFYKAIELNSIENVSGVGDCLASGYIAAMLSGCTENECVSVGLNAAVQSLLSAQTVPNTLRYEVIPSIVSFPLSITGSIKVE